MDHTGTLTHTTNSNRLTANLNLNSNFLLLGISSHNRFRSLSTSLQRTIQLRRHHLHTIFNTVNGNLHTNHTCRSNQHTISSHPKNLSSRICSLLTITITFCTSTCIGNTTVTDHHLCRRMIINNILIPFNRRSLHYIGSKSPRSHTRHLTVNHSHIRSALILNLSRSRSCLKSLSRRNAAIYNLHNQILLTYPQLPQTAAGPLRSRHPVTGKVSSGNYLFLNAFAGTVVTLSAQEFALWKKSSLSERSEFELFFHAFSKFLNT